jgi:hypothetical protein
MLPADFIYLSFPVGEMSDYDEANALHEHAEDQSEPEPLWY